MNIKVGAMRRWAYFLLGMATLFITLGLGAVVLAQDTGNPVVQTGIATPPPFGAGVDAGEFYFDARADLEVLADNVVGENTRPEGWAGNFDPASPSFATELWYDAELLATAVYGDDRPTDWLGATVASADSLVRNVRHDIELIADDHFGIGQRPDNWRGAPVQVRCSRTLLNTVAMLALFYSYESTTPDSAINYCLALASEIEGQLNDIIFNTPDIDGNLLDPIGLLSGVRGDLERLVDEELGLNTRPEGYIGNRDPLTSTFIGDMFLDLDTFADFQLGDGVRPEGWIGVISNAPGLSYYNLRHDVELLADTLRADQPRPEGWQGVNPLERCEPGVTYLKLLIEFNFGISFNEIDPTGADFCRQIADAVNAVVENPPAISVEDVQPVQQRLNGESTYAFTYLDLAALQYMGIMPGGVEFRAVYRNFGESTMMFVVGDNFAVWLDQGFTTLPQTVFNSLPTVNDSNPIAFCEANWCNGPGPTPTPTGSGPLELVILGDSGGGSIVPTPDPNELQFSKQLVSWNYVRVTYLQDNAATGTVLVTLELCNAPAQTATACEPVVSVFDNVAGVEKPIIRTENGMNVYEFRYGYATNLVIEGTNLYATDVWISDPTIR